MAADDVRSHLPPHRPPVSRRLRPRRPAAASVPMTAAMAPPGTKPPQAEAEAWRFTSHLHRAPEEAFAGARHLDWSKAPSFLPQPLEATIIRLPWSDPEGRDFARNASALERLACWLRLSLSCHRTRLVLPRPAGAGQAGSP